MGELRFQLRTYKGNRHDLKEVVSQGLQGCETDGSWETADVHEQTSDRLTRVQTFWETPTYSDAESLCWAPVCFKGDTNGCFIYRMKEDKKFIIFEAKVPNVAKLVITLKDMVFAPPYINSCKEAGSRCMDPPIRCSATTREGQGGL